MSAGVLQRAQADHDAGLPLEALRAADMAVTAHIDEMTGRIDAMPHRIGNLQGAFRRGSEASIVNSISAGWFANLT